MNQRTIITAIIALATGYASAQEVQNDANTPLHLLQPDYAISYGVPKADEVKAAIDRVRDYLDATTFTELDETGKMLKRGTFRLTSYEWGVTYSAMLRAGEVTGDKGYTDYAMSRMEFLCQQAPKFLKRKQNGETIDPLMEQVVSPDALDDCGAICSAMIKARVGGMIKKDKGLWNEQIDRYYDFIKNKEHRLEDGSFGRLRPVKNTVWLDDMFMGIPALAWCTDWSEAMMQFRAYRQRMWVAEKNLYRHGWVPTSEGYHPSFFWGRANGWALLTACELMDARRSMLSDNVKDDKDFNDILSAFTQHLSGLLPLQHHNGGWHQLLDRNDTYLETSCTAIYCYCIAHAINEGWLDAETYGPQAILAWNYVNAHINPKGEVEGTCVGTGLAFDPAFYAYRPVSKFAAHGYGPVIWAGAEMHRLVSTHHIRMNDSAVHFYPEDPKTSEPIFYVNE